MVGGAVGTRITFINCMGLQKKPPFSGQSSVPYFDVFYIIKRVSEKAENFSNVSPFLVEKAITGSVGTVTSTKLMRSKGVITCGRLLNISNEEIAKELGGQGVKDVRRINIRRDGELLPTKHFILTFNTPRLPEYIKAGYVRCSVRPYIPNPLRCFKCQRFGHSKTNCRGTLTCARCAVAGHESTDCTAVEKCVNCDGKHTSFSRSCPKWKVEKEVVATKYKQNISFPEARRLVKAQTPPDGKSYASVVDKSHPVYQTTNCPHCNHVVTMPNPVPSTSKYPDPVTIASSTGTKNKNILPKPSSQTSSVPPDSQDSSGFTVVNRKKKPKISSTSQSENNTQIKTNTATKFWKNSPQTSASEKAKNKILKNKPEKQKIS
ncbi:hypothetical protein AVEN_112644-1, partial [Araneus ventricosus]